ncbi:hypothetical protein EI427_21650 [Flammeovirga pectinis]|uniref:Uncharacterized protein n=1 Tax=Flammeovirga pectinis TaxID=2494373 RepID=A0A3S9P9L6_9BACT|nr:DUF1629 domain-containing protein [Flammeovirga pectinis]AZQ64833.1 hypothetical protein EI427_21650 [Flammeovirga pectinis]
MKYYKLRFDVNNDVLKEVPDIIEQESDIRDLREFNNLDRIPDFQPYLNDFIIYDKFKNVDILDLDLNSGIIVSSKFKDILLRHNLSEHRFYEANVFSTKGEKVDFHYLFLVNTFYDLLDLEKTKFYGMDWYGNKLTDAFNIKSEKDRVELSKRVRKDNINIEVVKSETYIISQKLDLIRCNIENGFLISERLKYEIEEYDLENIVISEKVYAENVNW